MLDRGGEVFDAQPHQEVFISLSFELGVVVGDNGVQEAMPAYEVFPGELLHLVGCDFLQWSCLDPLGKVVDSD